MNRYDEKQFFPFDVLGLRRNPFGTLTDAEWADISVIAPEVEAAFLTGLHLLILGDKGRGKSTTLRSLNRRLQGLHQCSAYERIPERQGKFHTRLNYLDAFALDEAQRLYPWLWPGLLWKARHGLRLLIGSHRNDTILLRGSGLEVVTLRLEHVINRAHVEALLARRLAYFARSDEPLVWFASDAIDVLWQHFGDNLRAQDSFLYEFFQQRKQPGAITAQMITDFAAYW